MLVIVSDLHFLDETAGRHNPSSSAFEHVFFPHIVALARSKGVRELKLLLLGDTFDLIRTEQWFQEDMADRPWGRNGLADVSSPRPGGPTERRCLRILGEMQATGGKDAVPTDTILYQNWEALLFLRELGDRLREELRRDIPVRVIFIPGNHDRLCNLYPSVRDQVQRILGASTEPDAVERQPDGSWWFRNDYCDEDHGVFARHGHQYDVWNFGGGNDHTRTGHLHVPIGDPLGVEFGAKLPYMLAQRKLEGAPVEDGLVDALKEMGLVRPFTHAMQWLHYQFRGAGQGELRDVLDETFYQVVAELLNIEFVRRWSSPTSRVDLVVRAISSRWLRWLPKTLIRRLDAEDLLPFFAGIGPNPRDPGLDAHLRAAYNEQIWRENKRIHYIAYGHTHFPMQRPLDCTDGHDVVYINTGSWRQNIYRTVGIDKDHDFMKFGQIAYSIFYRGDEDLEEKQPGTCSYETWVGNRKKIYAEGTQGRI